MTLSKLYLFIPALILPLLALESGKGGSWSRFTENKMAVSHFTDTVKWSFHVSRQ